LVAFYNPRVDWEESYRKGRHRLISEIDATAQIFKIHDIERLIFRIQLIEAGYSLLKALKVIYTILLKKSHGTNPNGVSRLSKKDCI
jgi:hypothetical protein